VANIVPGVLWQPIDYSGHGMRRKGRGAVAHVAVSESATLRPTAGGNSWHFYLPRSGPAIQYIDLDRCAYAQLDGNATMVSWESQGGVINPDGEPWTDNQVEWGARILAHLAATEGVPLQVMPDSLPTSKGLGWHRLGIDPWRVPGGERWSGARGKLCPGAAKIAQIPRIVARATEIASAGEGLDVDEATLRRIISEELDKKLDTASRMETAWNRLGMVLRNRGGDASLTSIGAAVKALLGGSQPPPA
jgi:hypothetical protein